MNQKVIFIIISIISIIVISAGGYFLYQSLNQPETPSEGPTGEIFRPTKKPKPTKTPKPRPTSSPSPSPTGPTGTIPPSRKECPSTLPSSFDLCFHNNKDSISILECNSETGDFIPVQAKTISEVDNFSQKYFQKTFTQLCSKTSNCKGNAILDQDNNKVNYNCKCEDQPPANVECDVCSGNTWVCNKGGYVCQKATKCEDLKIPKNRPFWQFCSFKDCTMMANCEDKDNTIKIECRGEGEFDCKNGGVIEKKCYDIDYNPIPCPNPNSQEYNNFKKSGIAMISCDCSNALVPGENGKKFTGDRCEYSDKFTCNNNGEALMIGTCVCNKGFAGKKCEISRPNTCNNRGNLHDDSSCMCEPGFYGNDCEFTLE